MAGANAIRRTSNTAMNDLVALPIWSSIQLKVNDASASLRLSPFRSQGQTTGSISRVCRAALTEPSLRDAPIRLPGVPDGPVTWPVGPRRPGRKVKRERARVEPPGAAARPRSRARSSKQCLPRLRCGSRGDVRHRRGSAVAMSWAVAAGRGAASVMAVTVSGKCSSIRVPGRDACVSAFRRLQCGCDQRVPMAHG